MAFRFKGFKNWFWPLLSGAVSIILGLMIINQWPVSGLWVIGLFVAVELMANGWSSIMITLSGAEGAGNTEVISNKVEENRCLTIEGLKDMIYELHPEIVQHALNLSVSFDEAKNTYVLTFSRGGRELNTYLEKQDADECMGGKKCIHLGVQIAQLPRRFRRNSIHPETCLIGVFKCRPYDGAGIASDRRPGIKWI